MAQNIFYNNNFLNQINEPIDNIFFEQPSNTTDIINKSFLDNKSQINNPSPNFPKSKSNFQISNIKTFIKLVKIKKI